ncbi:MAG TPA: AMP-binding protein, partial [Candidatus Deferrimicrobium sp.]|nr:AMP-binding protein [Candidatus Deferrimicrobium sp.]
DNQEYQYEDLVENIAMARDLSRNPLFDTMFALQNTGSQKIDIPGLQVVPYEYESKTAKFDLSLTAAESEEKLMFTLGYSTKLFKQETVARFIVYFKNIISRILENKNRRISDLDILAAEEKNRILYELNETERAYPRDKTIQQLFAEQAERTADGIAVYGRGQTGAMVITYHQLHEQSNRLAHLLLEKGVGPDTIVAIMMERSVEMIIGILGILKSGGAYLPIDTLYPKERIDYMLKDSSTLLLLKLLNNRLTIVDDNVPMSSSEGTGQTYLENSATSLAYIIYTSGSTGRPKGVLIQHRGIINFVYFQKELFNDEDYVKASQVASPGFDAMSFEIWPCLLRGAVLYIVPDEIRIDPRKIKEFLVVHTITVTFQSTALAMQLLDEEWPEYGVALKILCTAGDRLTRYPGHSYPFRLYNLYGPTEDTVWTTWLRVPVNQGVETFPAIGCPIANHRVYILDKYLKLNPIGITGEICISSVGTGRGYLNNPELTAEKFRPQITLTTPISEIKKINKSFAGGQGELFQKRPLILYRTGDLARWLPDGNLEFLG